MSTQHVQVDYSVDYEVHGQADRLVRIPLTTAPHPEEWFQEWWRGFRTLARGHPVDVELQPGRPWLVVRLRADLGTDEAIAQLDEATALLSKADEQFAKSQQHLGDLDQTVRDWWTGRRDGTA